MKEIGKILVVVLLLATVRASAEEKRVDFGRDVRPILEQTCYKCHGDKKQNGGLRFDRKMEALGVGDSGKKAIVAGKAGESELIRRVTAGDPEERMPPKGEALSAEQIKVLRKWIEEGAVWPETEVAAAKGRGEMVVTAEDRQHWSYRRLRTVTPPKVKDAAWGKTTIDRFVLAALEAKGLRANPMADRRTLIRRVYFDMLGLPPTPKEVEDFVADRSPDAYEKLVERVLGSTHYGERWGRHWLDVARYADSDGLETDADRPNAYHYRDFVIRALNEDLPYQTFVRWQIAGDEYEPDNWDALAATGFMAAAPNQILTVPMEEERLRLRFNELDDISATTASAFLGLTLACARCHDHKFDAIPTRDYYRLLCAFTTTDRDNVFLTSRAEAARYRDEDSRWNKRQKAAQEKLNGWLAEQKKPHEKALRDAKIDALKLSEADTKLLREQGELEAGRKLARKHEKALKISDEDFRAAFNDEQRRAWDGLKKELEAVQKTKPQAPPTALAVVDKKAQAEPTYLMERGNFYSKKEKLELGFLTVLTNGRNADEYLSAAREESPSKSTTGQRRALADWMTDVEDGAGALLARVMVNRVWQHHFGEGLSRTVSDVGVRSDPPSHPELLDWLAQEFVKKGWRLKSLHRLTLTSSVYMQSTEFDEERAKIDPDNRLMWRRRPQRLEAEVLRDAVLAVSGTLNPKQFGPAFKAPIPPEAIQARNTKDPYPPDAKDTAETRRRSVYMFHKRVVQHPFMQAFDGPDASVSCGRRGNTTVAPQALALMNDSFLRERSKDFAKRLIKDRGAPAREWVIGAFEIALSRPPTDMEREASIQFVEEQTKRRSAREKSSSDEEIRVRALADFCQALFGLNEFIYVD